jgi:hypothetical protein
MWKRIYLSLTLLILIGFHQAEAQDSQSISLSTQGMLLEPLSYVYKQNELREANATLCVINTSNEGPHWFLLNSIQPGLNERIGSISAALGLITDIKASSDGKYLAVLSVGEGHPLLEVIDLPQLLGKKTYTVLHKIDPYPGVVEIQSWQGLQLHFESDMLLMHRDKTSGRVPPDLALSSQEIFALNALTGEISGVSEGAKNPANHYSKILMDQYANETQKDAALAKLLSLNPDDVTISYLLKVLDQEQDPKRILRLLDEINKLREKPEKE